MKFNLFLFLLLFLLLTFVLYVYHGNIRELAKMREENSSFTLSLDDYTYFDENIISKMITANMIKVDFTGITVSSHVHYNKSG